MLTTHGVIMLLCDFHIHTNWSDGKHSIKEIVSLYGERGFRAIAITDHACERANLLGKAAHWTRKTLTQEFFDQYIAEIEIEAYRAKKEYNMIVVPGVEITKNNFRSIRSAHVLGLGVRQWIDPDQDIETILKSIRTQGGVSVAAHPVFTLDPTYLPTLQLWNARNELSSLVDAWEVASGPHLFKSVFDSGLPMIANSDLHHRKQIRSWKTIVHSAPQENAVLRKLKDQDLSFVFYSGSDVVPEQKIKTFLCPQA